MKSFRDYHLLQILEKLDHTKAPMDFVLKLYFRDNKALGSSDRKEIAEKYFFLIRWRGLLDYLLPSDKTWEKRLELSKTEDLSKHFNNPSIPYHIRCSHPKHFFQMLSDSLGQQKAFEFSLASNEQAPTTIRVNALKISRDAFFKQFNEALSLKYCQHSPFGLQLQKRQALFQTKAFKEGLFEMQDEASQIAAELVDAKPKEKVLDYCAGSGGKTLAYAPKMDHCGCIYLHDIRPQILLQAKKRLKRAGVQNAQIIHPTESKKLKRLEGEMDWVLLDVPCSGTGTYRRNPDLKWKFNEVMIRDLIEKQREIFANAFPFLKVGGKIVYLTCSVLKSENEEQINYFMEKYNLQVVGSTLKSIDYNSDMDGFFGAVLSRK